MCLWKELLHTDLCRHGMPLLLGPYYYSANDDLQLTYPCDGVTARHTTDACLVLTSLNSRSLLNLASLSQYIERSVLNALIIRCHNFLSTCFAVASHTELVLVSHRICLKASMCACHASMGPVSTTTLLENMLTSISSHSDIHFPSTSDASSSPRQSGCVLRRLARYPFPVNRFLILPLRMIQSRHSRSWLLSKSGKKTSMTTRLRFDAGLAMLQMGSCFPKFPLFPRFAVFFCVLIPVFERFQ
jgi:hypothetical protein